MHRQLKYFVYNGKWKKNSFIFSYYVNLLINKSVEYISNINWERGCGLAASNLNSKS